MTTDWSRARAQAGREAETEALAIIDPTLREESLVGVVRGNILRGDARRVNALIEELTSDQHRGEVRALYARYLR